MDGREATLALLAARAEDSTVCPSEVARILAAETGEWRDAMPEVHVAVDQLVTDGLVRLSWKGRPLASRAGPYRIGRRIGEAL
nr:DUF3253 domain-containing protein [uncultured Brevundimonas sp.]